jgi:hypothetical protein
VVDVAELLLGELASLVNCAGADAVTLAAFLGETWSVSQGMGAITALPEFDIRYVVVPRHRGHQLKDQAQLDGWLRDGSAAFVESICAWG